MHTKTDVDELLNGLVGTEIDQLDELNTLVDYPVNEVQNTENQPQ